MGNSYFQFKQFTVHQENAALKVSTDSCLLGAWVANEFNSSKIIAENILDIGAGTGLLMLMLAQQCDATIDGIELDVPSYRQAIHNSNNSPWKDRLQLFHGDVKKFVFHKKYDLIISNPPFYENDLKGNILNRNVAMHDEGLKLDELISIADKNLTAGGKLAVLLPHHRTETFLKTAKRNYFFADKRLDIKHSVNHSFFRSILLLGRKETTTQTMELSIKDSTDQYTSAFVELLKGYYLYL